MEIEKTGGIVRLEEFGPSNVLLVVAEEDDIEYLATNDLALDDLRLQSLAEPCWSVQSYRPVSQTIVSFRT